MKSPVAAVTLAEQTETFPELPNLAERLGVKPSNGVGSRTLLCMKNGDRYDLFELINAFLDRADAIVAQPK